MTAMITLSGSETGNSSDRLYAFFHKYYFAKAQEYFPEVLYNAAARVMYEDAKLAYIEGTYTNDTDPITQSMGNYYSGWKRWIKYRIQYMQSKYAFGDYAATGGDSIVVRASGNDITYDIIPAIWMYPCVANGTSIVRGERTKAGEVCQITVSLGGSADQQNHIKGAHFLQSIGGWWNKNVTGAMIVVGRMLRELRIGHETEDIVISIDTLTVKDTPSLQLLDVRRVATLAGLLDLSACTHLRYAYAGGTSVTQIALPGGGPLQHIEYSSLNQYLILRNFPLLKSEGVVITECLPVISDFLIENCSGLNPIDLLRSILAAQASQTVHSLKRVRAVGFNETYDTDGSAVLDDLAKLADGSYVGLDSSGLAGSDPYPVLDGELTINTFCYEDSVLTLRQIFTRLTINISGGFYIQFADPEVLRILISNGVGDGMGITAEQTEAVTSINTWFNGNTVIQSFNELNKFPYVQKLATNAFRKCSALTKVNLENITEIGSGCFYESGYSGDVYAPMLKTIKHKSFRDTNITSVYAPLLTTAISGFFEDYSEQGSFAFCKLLESVDCPMLTELGGDLFNGCSSLYNINIPNARILGANAFYKCTSLTTIAIQQAESIGNACFSGCSSLSGNLVFPYLTNLGAKAFRYTNIESFEAPLLTKIAGGGSHIDYTYGTFRDCKQLKKIVLPSVTSFDSHEFINCSLLSNAELNWNIVTKIGTHTFYGCTSLEFEELNLQNLETLGQNAYYGVKIKKMVLGKLTDLPTASSSTQNFGNKSVLEEVVLSKGLVVIPNYTFYQYTNLAKCTIPSSVTEIGDRVFQDTKVSDANLLNVTKLGRGCFRNTLVEYIDLPNIVEMLGESGNGAFYNCTSLKTVILGEHLTTIGLSTFGRCSNLESIVVKAVTPPTFGSYSLDGTNSTFVIYVPDSSVTAYREASGWVNYADRIKPLSEYTEL